MVTELPVRDVTGWPVASEEPRGDDEKVWLAEPGKSSEPRWLFKPVVSHAWGDQGEDWSEKIASEIGHRLGVPCATVEIAVRGQTRGLISRNLAPPPSTLYTGSLVLSGLVPEYQPGSKNVKGRPGHSLTNIQEALSECAAPHGFDLSTELTAFDVFTGYLMLDAFIANRDRHDENWAILIPPNATDPDTLCGSYDHASSLGFNLRDEVRVRMLDEERMERWVRKGTAYRFEHQRPPGPPTLVQLAASGLRMAGEMARSYWLDRLAALDISDFGQVVYSVPGMSHPARTFALEVLRLNRERLLDEC